VPEDAGSPYTVIERPRTRGDDLMGGEERFRVRLAIRVHTRFPPGKVDQSMADSLADSIHDSLTGADLTVTGFRTPAVLTPDVQPVSEYDVGEMRAHDLNLRYTFRF
jgi:hypothetical protein